MSNDIYKKALEEIAARDFYGNHTAGRIAHAALNAVERNQLATGEAFLAAEAMAIRFHGIYERLAPSFGYETRVETKEFSSDTPNGRLMIAVCTELFAAERAQAEGGGIDYDALISAAWANHKYAQGTPKCIAFKYGAEWYESTQANPPAKASEPLTDEEIMDAVEDWTLPFSNVAAFLKIARVVLAAQEAKDKT